MVVLGVPIAIGGVRAVIVDPTNTLTNSQVEEFKRYQESNEKSTGRSFPNFFGQYTGQEKRVFSEECGSTLV